MARAQGAILFSFKSSGLTLVFSVALMGAFSIEPHWTTVESRSCSNLLFVRGLTFLIGLAQEILAPLRRCLSILALRPLI